MNTYTSTNLKAFNAIDARIETRIVNEQQIAGLELTDINGNKYLVAMSAEAYRMLVDGINSQSQRST